MQTLLLIAVPFFPVLCALLCAFLPVLKDNKARKCFVMGSLIVSFGLAVLLCIQPDAEVTLFTITDSVPIVLMTDGLGRAFMLLMSGMWLLAGAYSFHYMDHEGAQGRYYTFYLLTLGMLMGLCEAGTLITMYLFFEMMTLMSVALVLHSLSKEAVAAGIKYLLYSIAGAMMGLFGVFYLTGCSLTPAFLPGGNLDMTNPAVGGGTLLTVIFITVVGFATKAGMFPMHGWLPTAHPIAPAPASAVLSGVITKAGVLCIMRVLFYACGAEMIRDTWVQTALLALCLTTVFMGSMMAFKTTEIKKRLAYSSVSQVSYVLFGVFMLSGVSFQGAMLHVYFHSIMKDLLFMCAGGIILKTGLRNVHDLRGIGRRMPVTMWCFTLAGVSLVGVPPLCGFYSKWQLCQGAIQSEMALFSWLGPVVLLVSALLTAAYLLPVSIDAFFPGKDEKGEIHAGERCELPGGMLWPMIVLAVALLLFGLFPSILENAFQDIAMLIL